MNKKLKILFIMLVFSIFGKAQISINTLEEVEHLRAEKMNPVVVLFSTDWCGVCHIQKRNLKKLPVEFWDKVYFVSINPEKYKKDIVFLGKRYEFISNGSSGLHQIAYEWAGKRVPAYPFWTFIDEKNQISTYEGMIKIEELQGLF